MNNDKVKNFQTRNESRPKEIEREKNGCTIDVWKRCDNNERREEKKNKQNMHMNQVHG